MSLLIVLLAIIQFISLKGFLSGDKFLLIVDGINQYTHFYSEFSEIVKNSKSIFWSWHQGIGSNYFGTMTYYVLGPVMFLLVLILPKSMIPYSFVIAFIIKQQLSAIFMFMLLKKYNFKKITCIIISLMWSCNAYFIHYTSNPMWIDILLFLPLIFIGIEKIANDKKSVVFVISIALSAISNYYLFFTLTIFTYIYIVIRYILKNNDLKLRKFIGYIFNISIYYLLAVGMAAVVLIPAVLVIGESTKGSGKIIPSIFDFNFNILINTLRNIFYNTSNNFNIWVESDALIYSGNLCILLLPLLFIKNNELNLKARIVSIAILFIELLSIANNFIYMGFHGFVPPLCFLFRFMYGFIIINLIITAYILDNIVMKKVKLSIGYLAIVLAITIILLFNFGWKIIIPNLIIFIIYFGLLKINKEKILLVFIVVELIFSNLIILNEYDYLTLSKETSTELFYNKEFRDLLGDIEDENELARVFENFSLVDAEKMRNSALTYGYSGLSTFTSTDNKNYGDFLEALKLIDVPAGMVNLSGNLISNEILNIKYAILQNDNPIPYGYEIISKGENYSLYENTNYLNGGFISRSIIKRSTFNNLSLIERELALLSNIIIDDTDIDIEENVEVGINYREIEIEKYSTNIESINENIIDTYSVDNPYLELELGDLQYGLSEIFMDIVSDKKVESIEIYNEDKYYIINTGTFTRGDRLYDLGQQNKKCTIKINLLQDAIYTISELKFYEADMVSYEDKLSEMKSIGDVNLDAYSNKIEGTINVEEDGKVFLSIPYNSGWKLYVNGEEREYEKGNIAFTTLNLEKGTYDIEMKYVSNGFVVGASISICSILILSVLLILDKNKRI